MSTAPKRLDRVDDNLERAGAQERWAGSGVDQQPSSPPANSSSRPEQPLTPRETTSPALPKSQQDDADTTSSLSAAPSPLTTHRPTSSKTSIDDQPLTPLDSPDKAPQPAEDPPDSIIAGPKEPERDADDKAKAQPPKKPSPAPAEKPVEISKTVLPEDKVGTILQLNAELINVYNEFHAKGQVSTLQNELQQYSLRIQANVQWLMQYKETLGTQFASRVPLQILSPPPPVPFTSTEAVNTLYAHLNSLFEKENARAQRKQQLRQMMLANSTSAAGATASDPISVNVNGKRERAEDEQPSPETAGDHSPRKRVDTGESKSAPGMPNTSTPSPASMHASPSRMNASLSYANLTAHASPAPGAPGGPLRPSSSQSNSSSHAAQAPISQPPSLPGGGSGINGAPGMLNPQQLDRMRWMQQQQQQQNRVRAMSGGAGSNAPPQAMTVNGGTPQPNPNPPPQPSQIQNGNPGAQTPWFGSVPRPVPATILPQLLNMIRNPHMHQSVQLLHSKVPNFGAMPAEQQAGVLWAFQQNQMKQQERQMQQQHQMSQIQPPPPPHHMGGQAGQMPGQGHVGGQMQPNMQQPGIPNGYAQTGAMGMRPSSSGSMQPPPSPHLMQQQRQHNLIQQQQQAALGRGPPGMNVGYPAGGMNPGMGMGMNGMGMGGHSRIPSNPAMGPPPVPMSASTPQSMYPQSMNQYPLGGVNPMNLSYPMQHQQQQPQQHQQQQQQYGMSMAGSPPNSAGSATWSPMSGGGGIQLPPGQALTPAAIMQQQQAKMGGMAPAPGPNVGPIDPNTIVNWTDLTAT